MHTFADPLRRAVQVAASKVALIDKDQKYTYTQLHERCQRLVGGLRALGLQKGDRVAIWSDNNHEYIETYVGVAAGGMVVVPLNTRHAEPELRYALEDSGTKVLITDRDAAGLSDIVEHIVNIGDEYEALLDAEPVTLGEDLTEDDLAGLFYTGWYHRAIQRGHAQPPKLDCQYLSLADVGTANVQRCDLGHGTFVSRGWI